MAELIHDYFTPGWRTRELPCLCGWRGDSKSMAMDLHDDVTDYACPTCGNMLLIVSHPDIDQVRQAAARGSAEARQQLSLIEEALAAQGKGPP
ncbi:MAG TPA: hypothetical protein VIT22_05535 [Pseudoxanthomonas sp.]